MSLRMVSAFFKSMWWVGVASKARVQYWKLLIRTSITRAKLLPLEIEQAIYWKHFAKITQNTTKEQKYKYTEIPRIPA